MNEDLSALKDLATAGILQSSETIEEKFGPPKDPKKVLRWAKYHTITNIILIIVLIAIGIYIWKNLDNFKTIGSDVCKLCMQRTGAICTKLQSNIFNP